MSNAKPWYKSKTIWFNLLSLLSAVLAVATSEYGLLPVDLGTTPLYVLLLVKASVNLWLRSVTTQPITATPPSPPRARYGAEALVLALLLFPLAATAQLKPWAGTGPVKYFENSQALYPATIDGERGVDFGDEAGLVGTVYARPANNAKGSTWKHWAETGDVSYWRDACALAAKHDLIANLRFAPLVTWGRGFPANAALWQGKWIDFRHAPTAQSYRAWVRAGQAACASVLSSKYTISDVLMLGQTGEPRYDQVPEKHRPEYHARILEGVRLHVELWGIERTVVFLYQFSSGADPEVHTSGDFGIDYLDEIRELGTPAGARQDGAGSGSKYDEFAKLRANGASSWVFKLPVWYEQWGGSVQSFYVDAFGAIKVLANLRYHADKLFDTYGGVSLAFMGWTVRLGTGRAINGAIMREAYRSRRAVQRGKIRAMLARITGNTRPVEDPIGPVDNPDDVGPPVTLGVVMTLSAASYAAGVRLAGFTTKTLEQDELESGRAFDPAHFPFAAITTSGERSDRATKPLPPGVYNVWYRVPNGARLLDPERPQFTAEDGTLYVGLRRTETDTYVTIELQPETTDVVAELVQRVAEQQAEINALQQQILSARTLAETLLKTLLLTESD